MATTEPGAAPLRLEHPLSSGHTCIINRLPTSAQGELFFDHLVPVLLPTVGEAIDKWAVLGGMVPAPQGSTGLGLGNVLERLVPQLGWKRVQFLAEKALATSTVNGNLVWGQRDIAMGGLKDMVPLTVAALKFHFGDLIADFIGALGANSFLSKIQERPTSEGSTASSGPSGG